MRKTPWLFLPLSLLLSVACAGDDGASGGSETDGGTGTGSTGGTGGACELDAQPNVPAIDESSCMPLDTDYQPLVDMSANDMWPPCITDDGQYHLVGDSPGSIGRVEGYEQIADLLWRDGKVPTPEDFTMARTIYSQDQGLESRILRREDLHYPPIPMEDWDPTVDPDKQCSVEANVQKYPNRCVGPALMQPLLNDAFAAGQMGEGIPEVHAARIQATLLWFLYISPYKESNTCLTNKAADCDSAWAYYTGGFQRDGGIGMSAEVRADSTVTHNRIFDGLSAVRCVRDLYPDTMYPVLDDLPPEGQMLFELGWEQLDNALHRGFALIVRNRLARQGTLSGNAALANWEFLKIAGPVLQREADERGPADQAAVLADLFAMECPTAADIEAGIAALDAIFPCP
ncbi:MAG: hypothetical protein D6705_10465 [Deltaproteobacteria bacterium]|nr:MAG: hypothetical protein D6705_10465 [Deltaproteobacteria bacterium]